MTNWCLIPNLILYSLSAIFYLIVPFRSSLQLAPDKRSRLEEAAWVTALFGFLLNLVYLFYFYFYQQNYPFIQSSTDMLGFLSCGVVGLFVWLVWRTHWQSLGSFFIPLALILFILSLGQRSTPESFLKIFSAHPLLISTHILSAFLSVFLMLGTFLLGVIFLLHERRLKQKKLDALTLNLPPLLSNEKRALTWLKVGFSFLTVVLITGAMLVARVKIVFGAQVFHIVLALTAWIIYAIILNRRWMGCNGRKMLLLSFLGFVSLASLFLWN